MAHYLQKVKLAVFVLGAVAALAAPKRPFSHKYHLTQVTACEDCHTAAATSTRAEDNLLPEKTACVTCHDEVEIGEPNVTGVQKFNHAKHVGMGSIAPLVAAAVRSRTYAGDDPAGAGALATAKNTCSGCHHGIPASENVIHGKASRAHFPHMADCLVCHNRIEPPESCNQCHKPPSGGFRPASHTAEFSDRHAETGFSKTGCSVCHGRKFTCKGCH